MSGKVISDVAERIADKIDQARALFFAERAPEAIALIEAAIEDMGGTREAITRARPEFLDAVILLTRIERREENLEQALVRANQAVDAAEALGDAGYECVAKALLARMLSMIGLTEEALEAAYGSMNAAANAQQPGVEAAALEALADVQWSMGQWDSAVSSYDRMLQLAVAAGQLELEAIAHGGLGGIHHYLGQRAESAGDAAASIQHFETAAREALEFSRCSAALGDHYNVRTAANNHAIALMALGKPAEARVSLEQLLDETPASQDGARAVVLKNISDADYLEGRFALARSRCEAALELSLRARQPHHSMACCEALTQICERQGEFATALQYHRRFHALYETVSSESAHAKSRTVAVRFETEKVRAVAIAQEARAERLKTRHDALSVEASRLAKMSLEDPLTGIGNRRAFDVAIAKAQLAHRETGESFSLAMLDVDHFKRINDTYSHQTGDQVLQAISQVLAANARRDDTVVRMGGDEFALLWHGVTQPPADIICERVRQTIAERDWDSVAPGLRVTVTIGLVSFGPDMPATSETAILRAVDQRLYAAKSQGRNRVASSDSP